MTIQFHVWCDYCGQSARLLTGADVYPHRPDLRKLRVWACLSCDAWVGTHKNSRDHKPLGRLANSELRVAKMKAHAAFDPLWKSGRMSRHQAYAWLADALGIPAEETHIGMFDVDMCKRVIEVAQPNRPTINLLPAN